MNTLNEQMLNNRVYLSGVIAEKPVFSHEFMGEGFYETVLRVKRLSDTSDLVPLTISERLLSANKAEVGDEIAIEGQFRSYNKNEDGKSRLILRVFVRDIVEVDPSKNPNTIELIGYVCKPPIYRTTPFKREICDLLIAVNRAYNKSDYIPCIAWGRNARYASSFNVGDRMIISGRIQSRDYNKLLSDGTYEKRTAYEVSVSQISVDEERADE